MPLTITVVRHGQSESNVAFEEAFRAGRAVVLERPDSEAELTPLGREQATELGRHLAAGDPPELVLCSPYRRTVQTWELVAAELGADPEIRLEPRLKDHDMGRWSGMNLLALRERFPGESENLVARLYGGFRPPEGESFPDVAGRIREVVEELRAGHAGRRVLVVAHDSVVLMFKHVIEDVPIDSVEAFGPVGNASVSVWRGTRPEVFNEVGHLLGTRPR
ncbi:histidine phosphatase family protein [Streptosporangium sp. NPDC005286]|uniref:histidine phosphatase family protein n=1 Tax=Streptosporangium sp. NPDC005286 TaxID=3154463 RepID=UPI0033A7D7A6